MKIIQFALDGDGDLCCVLREDGTVWKRIWGKRDEDSGAWEQVVFPWDKKGDS